MKIKICGLRRVEDVSYANEVKPDFIGFILTQGFRRSITKETARELKSRLNPNIKAVGVFVNEPVERIVEFLEEGIIDMAQLHGQESEEDIVYIKAATGKPVIKVVKLLKPDDIQVGDPKRLEAAEQDGTKAEDPRSMEAEEQNRVKMMNRYSVEAWMDSAADYLLFDSGTGTGKTFDWSVLTEALADYGGTLPKEFFLAGGISAENIDEAYETVSPYAVDLSSSVETGGVKDLEKMKLAVSIASNYASEFKSF